MPEEIPGVDRPNYDRVTLLDSLLRSIESLRNQNPIQWPRVVLISGDLLFRCDKSSISKVVEFLNQLTMKLEIEKSNVVICPGNHEQNRKILSEEPKAQFSSYREIWNQFYPEDFRRLPLEYTPGIYTHVYKLKNLEVLSLNSCEDLDPEPDETGRSSKEQGYIGLQQLKIAEDLLGNIEPSKDHIRVAVLHHHLSQYRWVGGIDYSILREVERVIDWLRKWNFDIIFHGHQHCAGLQTRVVEKRYLTILAGGSAGVASSFRWRGGMPLMYQLVYNIEPSKAMRICHSFDLYSEEWYVTNHEKPTIFPLGYVK